MWALTLPQVAATLAAAVVAFDTRNGAGQRMLDGMMLNARIRERRSLWHVSLEQPRFR